ncbi:MAG TPA: type I restriction-modification enzyme R subunit C-terminal domain-containing protein, partial [Cellvibrionaceae bacterium]|nr:type I restriction-modification enzyme R subunit C-terminal domain-containing protein [Cellvibrionaceae bacterium]
IAASIIGHIRQAAIGEALIPFEQRVARALQGIYQSQAWSPTQRKWLERLAKQLVHEVVIDQSFVNDVFGDDGGAKQLNKLLNNKLDEVLEAINDGLWVQAGP